ncbi:MAG: tRNA isopentenyl-2-thiomethyl-A-37 hydroxylase MiaE, partial [Flavobacteriaceae bacterium]
TLGRERPDYYVRDLLTFFPKGGSREMHLVHRLLHAGLIEARSCERFRLLSEKLSDPKLRTFYKKLMISEAHHYTLFLKLAKAYAPEEVVQKKWKDLLVFEAKLMQNLGKKENIHG